MSWRTETEPRQWMTGSEASSMQAKGIRRRTFFPEAPQRRRLCRPKSFVKASTSATRTKLLRSTLKSGVHSGDKASTQSMRSSGPTCGQSSNRSRDMQQNWTKLPRKRLRGIKTLNKSTAVGVYQRSPAFWGDISEEAIYRGVDQTPESRRA